MTDETDLRRMSQDERRQLAHALAALDRRHPLADPRLHRRMRFGLLFVTGCCLALAGWIAVLILTLPGHYTSTDWRTVWVGLDIAELAGFAATGWAAWHQRQIVTFFMIITGTLLVGDAWFDVALSYGSGDFTRSILSALLVELPLAFLMFASAVRLVRATIQILMELSGVAAQAPPLWRVPLFADGLEEALPARLRAQAGDVTAGGRASLGQGVDRSPVRTAPAERAAAPGVRLPFGDPLPVELSHLLDQVAVVQQDRPARADGQLGELSSHGSGDSRLSRRSRRAVEDPADRLRRQLRLHQESGRGAVGDQLRIVGFGTRRNQDHFGAAALAVLGQEPG
jgi:hypothetical protein